MRIFFDGNRRGWARFSKARVLWDQENFQFLDLNGWLSS